MAKDIYIGEVLQNDEIQSEYFLMKIRLSGEFENPLPGQFVMVRIAGLIDPFLSRPISVYSFTRNKSRCTMDLLYHVVGKGTQIMAGLIRGSQVEISGPLGGSYSVDPAKKNMVLIAGGIGVAPLSLLAQHLCKMACHQARSMTFYLGAQNAGALVGLEQLQKYCYQIVVCTDDGSMGHKALVTKAFQNDIKKYKPQDTAIYACGPKAMIRSLAGIIGAKYFCQVSLEERMACGVGACVGCAVAMRDDKGGKAYKRVCADGPVFELKDVIWE